jgi:lipopolysaccharide transport system permease protein
MDTTSPVAPPERVIEASPRWRLLDWQEVWHYRDMLYLLVWRDIKGRYAQTVLGPTWAVLQPVFNMIVFTIIFGRLVNVSSDGAPYALFSYAALVPWSYFSTALNGASNSLVVEARIISKVYFPRIILPLAPICSKLLDFGISMLLLVVMLIWFNITPGLGVLVLPLLLFMMMLTVAGLGMLLTALAVQYRDVRFGMGFVSSVLMYASPVIYPASLVPEQYRLLYGLNPMAGVIEGFRSALLQTNPMPWDLIGMGVPSIVLLLLAGMWYFRQRERIFADVA